ncbi:MAG: 8-amino-7-oxononanoate synthase [Pseudomonadales bacterium]|nr:8-amino-7-oxononanoate synthase [Pseudomonadales bacterium]
MDAKLRTALDERRAQGLYRERKISSSPQGTDVVVAGRNLLSFCSNDYLGLAAHPDVIRSFKNAADRYGVGSGASHLVSGHSEAHHALEEELAAFTGRSRALLFSSGYMANLGVTGSLIGAGDHVFEDRLNHASLLDGGLFSGARFRRYPHLESDGLAEALMACESGKRKLIVSDGVFSMDGDMAPLADLSALAAAHNAILMIDDAHGFGCLGQDGGGIASHFREAGYDVNEHTLPVLVGTLGKAFGTAGAFVSGSNELIETLIQFCRPYIYTTAMPPAIAEATRCSLKILQTESWRREHLRDMVGRFRSHCQALGFHLIDSLTPIQALVLGDVDKTVEASRILQEDGIFVSAIRPPTVPNGTARLRFTFSAGHTEAQFQRLLSALEKIALPAEE